jgi:hypothetical protein
VWGQLIMCGDVYAGVRQGYISVRFPGSRGLSGEGLGIITTDGLGIGSPLGNVCMPSASADGTAFTLRNIVYPTPVYRAGDLERDSNRSEEGRAYEGTKHRAT